MRKKLLKGFIGAGALALAFTTASCGLSDLASLIPSESTEDDYEPTESDDYTYNPTTEEKEESKIEKLAKTKGYECEFKYLDSEDAVSIRFGCKNNTFWFETLGEDYGAMAIQVKDNNDYLYYTKEDGAWKYMGFFENTDPDLTYFNIYQYLLNDPTIDDSFKKGASQTVAGRKCDVYTITVNYVTAKASVTYYIDQEYGILLKAESETNNSESMGMFVAFEATKFVVGPTLPALPEPADYKNANPETGSEWDLFKTIGLEGLVPSGYTKINSLLSVEEENDYSYCFNYEGYTEDQYKAKLNELVGTFNTVLKSKGDGGKLYKQQENYKEDLEEISSFTLGSLYDDPNEAHASIVVGDTLYWVTLAYVDYLGGAISVQVRVYEIEE